MTMKSIEIYYNIADLPGDFRDRALDFRNAAMERIEAAMIKAGVGEWEGAEIGMGEVNFGFAVEDFDAAEAVVRDAVAGTEFEGIREISRREFNPEDFENYENGPIPLKFRVIKILALLVLLPFLIVFTLVNVVRRVFQR